MHRTAAAFALLAIAAPVTSQTYLDQLIARVKRPKGGTAISTDSGTVLTTMTPAQSAAVDRLVTAPVSDPKISADRAAAAPLVRTLLTIAACARNGTAFNAVNRDSLTPRTYTAGGGGYVNEAPMRNMRYHDANACLDVVRLADWSKPAMNALRFRAFYVAGDSGEAANQVFELQKDADGRWLIRSVGKARS